MLPVTNAFRDSIYAAERQILSRATITMDAFGDASEVPIAGLAGNLLNKVSGSVVENPHKFKTASNSSLYSPTNVALVEQTTAECTNVASLNATTSDKINAAVGARGLQVFSFDVIQMLERQYGTDIWQGKTTLAEKITLAKSYLSKITLNWHGFGQRPSPTFGGFRYIRDTVNGSTANTNGYWNEIKCMAGATNRCAAKVPTSNGTLTNGANVTDGNGTTYGYVAGTGAFYVQIDLGAIYTDIDTINIIHYYLDGRTFHGAKVEVSSDGTNWTTLRDSAVSGEYVETAGGLTLQPTSILNYAGLASWEGSAYGSWNTHSSAAITKLTNQWTTNLGLVIDATGFFHCCAYSEISNNNTVNSRIKTDYVELILDGTIRITTRVYDNNKILRWNSLEEINVLNDSLPANELSITLDNQDGEFNILTYGNMFDVLASKPTVFLEAGLVTPIPITSSLVNYLFEDFPLTTIATDWTLYGSGVTLAKDTGFGGNGQKITVVNGSNGGINSGYDMKAVPVGAKVYVRFLYKGAQPNYNYIMSASGNKVLPALTVTPIDGTWFEAKAEVTTVWGAPADAGIIICLDQRVAGVDATTTIDEVYVSTSPYGSTQNVTEWIPCGKYFVTEWKNDLANRVISFTCHDWFYILGDTSYGPTPTNLANDMQTLANDVLTTGGVPAENRIYDEKLDNIFEGIFFDRTDCRTALQNIAICAQACVYQDRYGNINIKRFATIDKISNFLLYTRDIGATPPQRSVAGNYAGPNTYSVISTGSGMKFIDYDMMFDSPEIELAQNIYQLIIKVYTSTTDSDTQEVTWDSRDTIHNNPHISGNTGLSFTIDNPLVRTDNMANEIADWYFDENLYNATFRTTWRQNPAIECTDMVLIEDPFHSNKQTRVFKQEMNYEGYLEGITESRGGV